MKLIYVDNNATTKVAPEVIDVMLPFFNELWGNPSSMHTFGGQVAKHIEKARSQVADAIGAEKPNEIIFTSCGTEGDNTAIRSALQASPTKRHIVSTLVEHPAVLNLLKELSKQGYEVTFLPVDGVGHLNLEEFKRSLKDQTALVSVMWANNETGMVFPIEKIANICAEKNIPLHVDAVQAVGKIPVNLKTTPITYLVLSGHKINAPKGVGALYVRRGTKFHPWLIGGHQEHGRRAGTENTALIVGLGKACELAKEHLKDMPQLASLRDTLEAKILKSIERAYVNGDPKTRVPNTTSVSFESVEGEAILLLMNEYQICASSGSACTSGSLNPSHVLMAMNIPFTRAHGSIRFSLSRYNTKDDIDFIIEKLPPIIKHLRALSPVP